MSDRVMDTCWLNSAVLYQSPCCYIVFLSLLAGWSNIKMMFKTRHPVVSLKKCLTACVLLEENNPTSTLINLVFLNSWSWYQFVGFCFSSYTFGEVVTGCEGEFPTHRCKHWVSGSLGHCITPLVWLHSATCWKNRHQFSCTELRESSLPWMFHLVGFYME